MSFGRGSKSQVILPRGVERALIVVGALLVLGLLYATYALLSCALHSWCPP